MGVTECDNMLMLLGISNKMTDRVSTVNTAIGMHHANILPCVPENEHQLS